MNTAAAIEIAVAAVLRQYATLGEGVVVRPSQSLNSDPTWKKSKDRTYPMVSVQCSTPDPEDGNPAVMEASCRVVCGTWNDDDKDHNKVREMFDGATSCLSRLFGAFRKGNEATRKRRPRFFRDGRVGTENARWRRTRFRRGQLLFSFAYR